MFRYLVVPLTLLFVARSTVSDVTVNVGGSSLSFSPNTVTASAGTIVSFVVAGRHSITQSTFGAPCTHSGFNSGRLVTGNTFSINITDDTQPIWFYCNVGTHCGAGMVGAINPPTTGNTFDTFHRAATALGMSEPSQPDADQVVTEGNGATVVKGPGATTSDSVTTTTTDTTSSDTTSSLKSTSTTHGSSSIGHSTLTISPTFALSSATAAAAPSSSSTQTSDATRVFSSTGIVLLMSLVAIL